MNRDLIEFIADLEELLNTADDEGYDRWQLASTIDILILTYRTPEGKHSE